MDYHDIFISCRLGDLEKVKYLVESREVELNVRDKWDTTPLYYACLCGHEQLVKYLLENGAKCEANTFDGERCLYAALNDSIKRMLRNFKMITSSTMRRDQYDELLRKMLNDKIYADVTFSVLGEKEQIHRCILATRCPNLHDKLEKRLDDGKIITIKDLHVDPSTFRSLLGYIYQGHVQVPYENLSSLIFLARQFGLSLLEQQLEKKLREKKSFESSKPGVHVDVLSIDSQIDKESVKRDLTKLADQALPNELYSPLMEMPFQPVRRLIYPDVCFIVDGYKYLCHKAFFCLRSDYFKALLRDHFDENSDDKIVCINIHEVSTQVFTCVLYYVYTDLCELDGEIALDVLHIADLYLLPGLKRLCGAFISNLIDEESVFSILETSRLFVLPKVEDRCAEYIADNIEEMVNRVEFADIILSDAKSIKARQESDSIDIVDSVRYHLTSHVQTYSEIESANYKLQLIDELLDSLELDC